MNDIAFDKQHIWHPYTSIIKPLPVYKVKKAKGCKLFLDNNKILIDGMSSWWCVIHGYNNDHINNALKQQINKVSHVMFGGLTHGPAIELTKKLINILPKGLEHIFFADSGSVSVEAAMKMALQYWQAKGKTKKKKFVTIKKGYHGDTIGAMSVCDPITGMHSLFKDVLIKNIFLSSPGCKFGQCSQKKDVEETEKVLKEKHGAIAAFILEPIVQGAGGMKIYSSEYLKNVRKLCTKYNVLLIADEIATGFGRTGKMFACDHAGISPDIMCIGKSLTGGYLTLAAVAVSKKVAHGVSRKDMPFMHGPTFMASPLACTAANASIELLEKNNWKKHVSDIEKTLIKELDECKSFKNVKDVRVIGALGVVQMKKNVDVADFQKQCVKRGVWIRPFMDLIYLMPPYVISKKELLTLTRALKDIIRLE
ncbi:MAG: adenosylmethionine--8-amino-7-oxononanoate transaminase [Candidatus Omnitrophica bacterium]|nr:adenosylmethionine--8-amino-7-oxononanoate transaminase [Candidatus Omnitrophota bacterium]